MMLHKEFIKEDVTLQNHLVTFMWPRDQELTLFMPRREVTQVKKHI